MTTAIEVRVSKSALENFKRCARCFYLDKVQKLKQPDGIRAGVPMGLDRVIKGHWDNYRAKGQLPPEVRAELAGWIPYPGNRISMKDLRNWRVGLTAKTEAGAVLSTAFDEMLYHPEKKIYRMADYKSKAKATDEAATRLYYELQGDSYTAALEQNGYPTDRTATFVYYFPVNFSDAAAGAPAHSLMGWGVQVINIGADPKRALDLTEAATAVLTDDKMPRAAEDCEYCAFVNNRVGAGAYLKSA